MTEFWRESDWESDEPVVMNPGLPREEVAEVAAFARGCEKLAGTVLFSTSGSSGARKWVALERAALLWSARRVVRHLEIGPSDVLGLALPLFHVGGFGLLARQRISGASLESWTGKWAAELFARWAAEKRVSVSSLVPTQVSDLVSAACRAPATLRAVVVGGGRLEESLKARAGELGWPLLGSYGMTETASQIATALPGADGMRILPDWEVEAREGGRLWVRGGGLLRAYLRREEGGLAWSDPKVDGWFETSDFGELASGRLQIKGRADRRVKVLGELVDLEAIEAFFRQNLGVAVRVRAEADERAGHLLFLKAEGAGRRELAAAVRAFHHSAQGFERLSGWEVVAELPRSALGKVVDA